MAELRLRVIADDQASRLLDSISGKFKKSGQAGQKFGKQVEAGARRVDKSLVKVEAQSKKTSSGIAQLAKAAATLIIFRAVAGFIIEATKAAVQFQEVQAKFETVFRNNVKEAEGFASVLVDSFNISESAAKEYLSTIQDTLVPMGLARSEAAKLSNEVIQLAADLSSFNNVPTAVVVRDLQSALVGNTETIKKYGVVLKATDIQQRALATSGKKSADALTNAEKVTASYQLILEGTADAQGDVARTSQSSANQLRKLGSSYKDLTVLIGKEATPVLRVWVGIAQRAINATRGLFNANRNNLTVDKITVEQARERIVQLNREIVASKDLGILRAKRVKKLSDEIVVQANIIKETRKRLDIQREEEEASAKAADAKAQRLQRESDNQAALSGSVKERAKAQEEFETLATTLRLERMDAEGRELEATRERINIERDERIAALRESASVNKEISTLELDAAILNANKVADLRIVAANKTSVAFKNLSKVAGAVASDIENNFANAFADITLEAKTFAEVTQGFFKTTARIAIQELARIAARAALTRAALAFTGPGGFLVGGAGGFAHGTQRVPGPVGQARLAVVHGGEQIGAGITSGAGGGGGGGGGRAVSQTFIIQPSAADVGSAGARSILRSLSEELRGGSDEAREFASESQLAADRNEGLST